MIYRIIQHVLRDTFAFAFVLNKQSVLRVLPGNRKITMLHHGDCPWPTWRSPFWSSICRIAFALDGKTIYCAIARNRARHVVSFDVSSGDRKAGQVKTERDVLLVPVSEGVLLKPKKPIKQFATGGAVELWNFELSQIVRSWPNLSEVRDIMPVSDLCVACVGEDFEVSILDTSNGNIVKTIPLCHKDYSSTYDLLHKEAIVCNSKYQLLSTTPSSVQLSDGENILWKKNLKQRVIPGMFSPTEEFVLVSSTNSQVIVLEASSGKHLRTLCTVDSILGCAFVSKTECVIVCKNTSGSCYLPLFNVSTGDVLTVLDIDFVPSRSLASCPRKGLIAIGLEDSEHMCAVIQVKLPRDKVNREAKGK